MIQISRKNFSSNIALPCICTSMQMLDITEDDKYTKKDSQNLFITTPTQFLSFESINLMLPQLKFTLYGLLQLAKLQR